MKDLLLENLNEENDNNIQITRDHRKKRSFHRKTESSLFLGEHVYNEPKTIPSIIPDFNNLNSNNENNEETLNKIIENNNKKKEINNSNIINSNNISFNSFEDNDGSVIIKTDDNSIKKEFSNSVSIFKDLELAAEKNNSYKSFIQLHNTLKYKKNKEENATESYLLALGLNGNNNNIEKRNLINSNQIIEEEKSDILNSESEFSSKKKFLKKNLNNKNIEPLNFNIDNIVNYNNNNKNELNKNIYNQKINSALNEIIIKNNEKEQNRREFLTKNKKNLLSYFFNIYNNSNENINPNKNTKNNNNNIVKNYNTNSNNKLNNNNNNNKIINDLNNKIDLY